MYPPKMLTMYKLYSKWENVDIFHLITFEFVLFSIKI